MRLAFGGAEAANGVAFFAPLEQTEVHGFAIPQTRRKLAQPCFIDTTVNRTVFRCFAVWRSLSDLRRKFVAPLYTNLAKTDWGKKMALDIYKRRRMSLWKWTRWSRRQGDAKGASLGFALGAGSEKDFMGVPLASRWIRQKSVRIEGRSYEVLVDQSYSVPFPQITSNGILNEFGVGIELPYRHLTQFHAGLSRASGRVDSIRFDGRSDASWAFDATDLRLHVGLTRRFSEH
jgi:hypothetical protein